MKSAVMFNIDLILFYVQYIINTIKLFMKTVMKSFWGEIEKQK